MKKTQRKEWIQFEADAEELRTKKKRENYFKAQNFTAEVQKRFPKPIKTTVPQELPKSSPTTISFFQPKKTPFNSDK